MGNLLASPAPPSLTEKNLSSQAGKVFVVTGSTSGIGFELAQILYAANAKVWIVARSSAKAEATVGRIRTAHPNSQGQLEILIVDFNNLTTIKPAVEDFLRRETRLDVLWNNAGVMIPPKGTVTAQQYEAQIGVNALAPHLFTKLLAPVLLKTAEDQVAGRPRVVWVSSSAAERFAPQGGVDLGALGEKNTYSQWQNYGMSKAANIFQAAEFARRYRDAGILSVAADPGNLDTNLYQNMPRYQLFFAKRLALKPAIYGAYTELFAGLSGQISAANNGAWVVPWGQVSKPRKDIDAERQSDGQDGNGVAKRFWEWCEEQVAMYE